MDRDFIIVLFAISNIILASAMIRYSEVGPVATFGYRLLIPAFILYFAGRSSRKSEVKFTVKTRLLAMLCGVMFGLDFIFFSNALIFTSITEANLLANLCPFVVTIIAIVFFREKVPMQYGLVLLSAFTGIVILMSQAGISNEHALGNIFALIAMVFYSFYIIISKDLRDNYSTIQIMFYVSFIGAIIDLIAAYLLGEKMIPDTFNGVFVLFAIAIIGHIFGHVLYTGQAKFMSLSVGALSLLTTPIFALVYGYILFRETFSLQQSIGIFIIVVSIFLGKKVLDKQATKE